MDEQIIEIGERTVIDLDIHGEEMVWMRHHPGSPEPYFSKIVVHGHTAVEDIDIQPRRINLDTACVYGRRLSAMQLYTHKTWCVQRTAEAQPTYLRDSNDPRRTALRFKGRVPVLVHHEGNQMLFETLNYSEIGLLMSPVDPPDAVFTPGMTITGTIGLSETATTFKGMVLRVEPGPRIALKILVDRTAP